MVVVNYNRTSYLIDGQHRYEVMKQMIVEHVDMNNVHILIEVHDCGNNLEFANSLYYMANNRYNTNGTITNLGVVNVDENAKIVVTTICNKFREQTSHNPSTKAPYFDPNILLAEINQSEIIRNKTSNEVIEAENRAYFEYMRQSDIRHLNCKARFYLPYKDAKCRWVRKLK